MQPHKRWLLKAQEDLEFARLGQKEGGPPSLICFHCQQTAEKALKGFLVFKNRPFPKTHSLENLAALCTELRMELNSFKSDIRFLDQLYVPVRYPDAPTGGLAEGSPTPAQVQRCLDVADRILQTILSLVA